MKNAPKITRRPIAVWLSEGGGLGLIPWAPGTWGTLPGVALVGLVWSRMPAWPWQAALGVALALAAVPLCSAGEKFHGTKDPHPVVADEYLCFPVCMIGLTASLETLVLAFLTFRMCDIVKPWPARGLQRLPGGWGIAIDDFFAALWALALNHAIVRFAPGWFA